MRLVAAIVCALLISPACSFSPVKFPAKSVSIYPRTRSFVAQETTEGVAAPVIKEPIPGTGGPMELFAENLVDTLKSGINVIYGDRHWARFYALETVARVPYFSYLSVLHLYETLGWFRKEEYLKLHFAESWNEMHHLLIMGELGGAKGLFDRFFAQHAAVVYYFLVVLVYLIKPELAYTINKKVEWHAYKTYKDFCVSEESMLKSMPVPKVAQLYYGSDELFQSGTTPERVKIGANLQTLFDVMCNIRDDEAEHAVSMEKCQQEAKEGVFEKLDPSAT